MSPLSLPQLMQMWRHWRLWFLSVFSAALLAACGGGELVGGVGSGGTGAYGAINGFGSIIVNGVRYKDDTAKVFDDSGNGSTLTQSDLKLGMVVEISGDDVVAGVNGALPTSNAGQVYVRSEIKGPVEAISGTTLTVLGQTVNTTASTVYDALTLPGGFSDIQPTTLVEIYGYADGQGNIVATRIEKEDSTSAYKLRGTVTVLTATTFQIGNAVINYATATEPLLSLSEGMTVRVELNTTPNAGVWTATKVKATRTFDSLTTDGFKAEIEGSITSYTSAQSFSVNGIAVNAANAATIPDGLGLGSVVEVEGTLTNGTLIATKVELEDDDALDKREFELHGRIDALDTVAQTLQIRGVTVQYSSTTQFESGSSATNLSSGVAVEIKGTLNNTGTLLIAERIEFEDLDDERSESGYELKGTISALDTTAKTFVVRGVTVDYNSTSLTVDDGTLADLADGALIEVRGTPNSSNDRLIATEIDFEDSGEMEIEGEITAVNGSSFTLNGITYTYDGTTEFRDGTAINLVVNATVDIRVIDNGGTYTVTRITFED